MCVCHATGLTPRISISASPSLRTSCRVASITTSTPSSTRLSDITLVFSPGATCQVPRHFQLVLQDTNSREFFPVYVFRLEWRVVLLFTFIFQLFDLTFILIHAQAMLAPWTCGQPVPVPASERSPPRCAAMHHACGPVLVVEVQPALVEVRLDILRDGLSIVAFDALDQYRLAALEVGTLVPGQLHVPYLFRYLELGTLLEAVRCA